MLEALWAVEFQASTGWAGAGVVVFETGRILGGDGSYYYLGNYRFDANRLSGTVTVQHFAGPRSSVFGPVDRLDLSLAATLNGAMFQGLGQVVGRPDLRLGFRLRRLAELP